ncbi:MAG: glycosyltransferase [Anaerolineaceae bacterium]|nr:glycosyltransferase [Anaerolineaceae bacterium]MCB9102228.1 glycosyltransferase [Anaerolineales bacterium]
MSGSEQKQLMPIPIVHLITELSAGGAQMALFRLLQRIDRRQFSPVVACLYNGDAAVAQLIRGLEIPVLDLGMKTKLHWGAFWRLYRLLRQIQPVILHTWLFHANLPGRLVGRLAGVPTIICSERTMAMESEWRYRLNRWTIGLVDQVVAVSANVRDFTVSHIGLPAEKVMVIYNGLDISSEPVGSRQSARRELDLPAEVCVIGAVSRLDPVKGINVLLRAMVSIADGQLVIIGDGPEWDILQKLTSDLGLTARVHWAGYRADVTALLPAFDILVQPSLHEGLPNTVLEAMAARLPVVATAVGGTPELVEHGRTGLLVPAQDAAALASAINLLKGNTELSRQMGQAGFDRVRQQFTVEQMAHRYETLYHQLISPKSGVNEWRHTS